MGVEGAVNIIFRDRIAQRRRSGRDAARADRRVPASSSPTPTWPPRAATSTTVIEPRETRPRLIAALEMLQTKRDTNPPKKHGNIPL